MLNEAGKSTIRDPLFAFIQAGGKSSRMGTDKAWVEIGGRPMIEGVLAAAAPVTAALSLVIGPETPARERYEGLAKRWNARLLTDENPDRGPLGGIHTALKSVARGETGEAASLLILACDLPFLSPDFLALLGRIHHEENNDLTAPLDASGRLQPLAAIYSAACLQPVESLLARGIRRVDRLRDLVRIRRVAFQEYATLPNAGQFLANINSRDDHWAARSRAESSLICPSESGP